jgi:hypothetical protein
MLYFLYNYSIIFKKYSIKMILKILQGFLRVFSIFIVVSREVSLYFARSAQRNTKDTKKLLDMVNTLEKRIRLMIIFFDILI